MRIITNRYLISLPGFVRRFALIFFMYMGLAYANNYYAFEIPWDISFSNELNQQFNFEVANRQVKYPLDIYNGKLYDQSGIETRYWGVAIAVSKHFPPRNKKDIDKVVNKISQFGFNLVRINGLDFPAYGLYEKWYKTGKLDKKTMDSLDYFVYSLRQKGIAYSFSINNSSLKGSVISGAAKNTHPVDHKKYKYVQLFDSDFINTVKKWHHIFYSHVNKYTGIKYAQDGFNIYATIVGEDSHLNAYMRGNGIYLTKDNFDVLQNRFNQYLAQKYTTQAELERAWNTQFEGSILSKPQSLSAGTIQLSKYNDLSKLNTAHKTDIMQFLIEMDMHYGKEIRGVLLKLGFKGKVAFTNDWYGYGALLTNNKLGDMLDLHGYFDPMSFSNVSGERRELVRNTSYIDLLSDSDPYKNKDFNRNLKIFFSSSISGYPIIVSEWNHSLLSRYLYEGPVLMTMLSSLQGYSGLVGHTYFSTRKNGYKNSISRNSLILQGNPVFMALSPVLSFVYRNSLIPEFQQISHFSIGGDVYDFIARDGLHFNNNIHNELFVHGFKKKLEINLNEKVDKPDKTDPKNSILTTKTLISDGVLSYKNDQVWILAGKLVAGKANANISYLDDSDEAERGAIVVASLDGRKIPESTSIFVTAVSDFMNTGQEMEYIGKYRIWDHVESVKDYGRSPALLRALKGKLSIEIQDNGALEMFTVSDKGNIKGSNDMKRQDNKLVIDLKSVETPWLWINKNEAQ